LPQDAHAGEVVGGHGKYEQLVVFLQATHHDLANRRDQLGPAKALLYELALLLDSDQNVNRRF